MQNYKPHVKRMLSQCYALVSFFKFIIDTKNIYCKLLIFNTLSQKDSYFKFQHFKFFN